MTSQELPFPTDRSHSRQSGDDSSISNDWFFRKTFFCHNSKVFRFVLCIKMTLNMRQMSLSVMPRNKKHQLWTHHHKSAHLAKSKLVIVFKMHDAFFNSISDQNLQSWINLGVPFCENILNIDTVLFEKYFH